MIVSLYAWAFALSVTIHNEALSELLLVVTSEMLSRNSRKGDAGADDTGIISIYVGE